MPLYFIDTVDERMTVIDDEGHDLDSDEEAILAALLGMADLVRSAIVTYFPPAHQRLEVKVRRANGEVLYTATVEFTQLRRVSAAGGS